MPATALQKTIGYTFQDKALLTEALTHPSMAHENGHASSNNQRLEFLGDAVLQLLLTDRIFELHPNLPEGQLTQIRAHLANRHSLYRRARVIDLGRALYLGKGEEASGGRDRLSVLADAFEALLGAVYLDGGIRAARAFVNRQFRDEFKQTRPPTPHANPKGQLQELLQAKSPANPTYRVVDESGPDHHKHFAAVVEWEGREIGRGEGPSKKLAEAAAAQAALAGLQTVAVI